MEVFVGSPMLCVKCWELLVFFNLILGQHLVVGWWSTVVLRFLSTLSNDIMDFPVHSILCCFLDPVTSDNTKLKKMKLQSSLDRKTMQP